MPEEPWEEKLDLIVAGSGVPVQYDAKPGRERYSRGVIHMSPKPEGDDERAEWARVLLKELARATIRKRGSA